MRALALLLSLMPFVVVGIAGFALIRRAERRERVEDEAVEHAAEKTDTASQLDLPLA